MDNNSLENVIRNTVSSDANLRNNSNNIYEKLLKTKPIEIANFLIIQLQGDHDPQYSKLCSILLRQLLKSENFQWSRLDERIKNEAKRYMISKIGNPDALKNELDVIKEMISLFDENEQGWNQVFQTNIQAIENFIAGDRLQKVRMQILIEMSILDTEEKKKYVSEHFIQLSKKIMKRENLEDYVSFTLVFMEELLILIAYDDNIQNNSEIIEFCYKFIIKLNILGNYEKISLVLGYLKDFSYYIPSGFDNSLHQFKPILDLILDNSEINTNCKEVAITLINGVVKNCPQYLEAKGFTESMIGLCTKYIAYCCMKEKPENLNLFSVTIEADTYYIVYSTLKTIFKRHPSKEYVWNLIVEASKKDSFLMFTFLTSGITSIFETHLLNNIQFLLEKIDQILNSNERRLIVAVVNMVSEIIIWNKKIGKKYDVMESFTPKLLNYFTNFYLSGDPMLVDISLSALYHMAKNIGYSLLGHEEIIFLFIFKAFALETICERVKIILLVVVELYKIIDFDEELKYVLQVLKNCENVCDNSLKRLNDGDNAKVDQESEFNFITSSFETISTLVVRVTTFEKKNTELHSLIKNLLKKFIFLVNNKILVFYTYNQAILDSFVEYFKETIFDEVPEIFQTFKNLIVKIRNPIRIYDEQEYTKNDHATDDQKLNLERCDLIEDCCYFDFDFEKEIHDSLCLLVPMFNAFKCDNNINLIEIFKLVYQHATFITTENLLEVSISALTTISHKIAENIEKYNNNDYAKALVSTLQLFFASLDKEISFYIFEMVIFSINQVLKHAKYFSYAHSLLDLYWNTFEKIIKNSKLQQKKLFNKLAGKKTFHSPMDAKFKRKWKKSFKHIKNFTDSFEDVFQAFQERFWNVFIEKWFSYFLNHLYSIKKELNEADPDKASLATIEYILNKPEITVGLKVVDFVLFSYVSHGIVQNNALSIKILSNFFDNFSDLIFLIVQHSLLDKNLYYSFRVIYCFIRFGSFAKITLSKGHINSVVKLVIEKINDDNTLTTSEFLLWSAFLLIFIASNFEHMFTDLELSCIIKNVIQSASFTDSDEPKFEILTIFKNLLSVARFTAIFDSQNELLLSLKKLIKEEINNEKFSSETRKYFQQFFKIKA